MAGSWSGVVVAVSLALGSACGPSIVLDDDAETTGGDPPSSGTSGAPGPGTAGPTMPPGPPDAPGDSGGESSGAVGDTTIGGSNVDDGCAFGGCGPDGGSSDACDLFAQDCPPGEKCMPWANDGGAAWNATRCSPVARDPGQSADACTVEGSGVSGVDDCDVGLMCWNVDENGAGVCAQLCGGSPARPTCEDPEAFCSISGDGVIALCFFACHPLLQDCPAENEVCYPTGNEWACYADCGCESGAYGDACEYASACHEGNVCIAAEVFTSCGGAGCCSSLCDLSDADADAFCQALDPAQTCEPWYIEGNAPAGYDNVGVCAIAS